MPLKVTHRIALGFSLLVFFIMIVGGGGLWGTDNINRRLHDIADRSLPTAVGSFNQLIALQKANIDLLSALANDDADPTLRLKRQESFQQQIDIFAAQQQVLEPLLVGDNELQVLLEETGKTQNEFAIAAARVMELHNEQLKIDARTRQKESRFQRQIDSLTTWGQQYISKNSGAESLAQARNFMRNANTHKNQLINFKQSNDFSTLEADLKETKNDLRSSLDELVKVDAKASRIKVLVRDLLEQLYSDNGMVQLYRELHQLNKLQDQQLLIVDQRLNQAQSAAEQFSALTLERSNQLRLQADNASDLSQSTIIALLIGVTGIAVLISALTVRTISSPLKQMMTKLSALAEGDMRINFDHSRLDEFGQLGEALNEVVGRLRDTLTRIAAASQQLTGVAEQNSVISNQTTLAMSEQSQQLEMTSSAAFEMESTVAEVSNHARATLQAVQQCEQLSSDADNYVQQTLKSIEKQSLDIGQAVEQSDQLSQYSQQIGSILDTIGAIADQTNLLALNAAIEAARAGDHGRGFAVVADEVRSLASRTQNSTHEIHEMVENMQNSIQQVVTVMHQSVEQSKLCVTQAGTSQTAILEMNQAISNIRDMSTQIAEAANQQDAAVEEVSRTLVRINEAATETTNGAQSVTATSTDLLKVAQEQKQLIEQFKTT